MIELLMVIGVMGILGGVQSAVIKAGFDSWIYGVDHVFLQRVADHLMEQILEGGFEEEGLKDAVELREAELTGISIVPLWTDRTHKPNPQTNKTQQFTLEKQFKAGAVTPIGQVRAAGSDDWVTAPVSFAYGKGNDPKAPDDVVTFTDHIPLGSDIQMIYTPDASVHPDTQMRFWWNPEARQIYRTYAGETRPVYARMEGVTVERLAFLYYDNLNRLYPLGREYTKPETNRMTGVKIYILLRRGDEWKELSSFTNVRNVETIGSTITVGSVLPLPSPADIKALSIGDFYGRYDDGIVELVVTTRNRARWKIQLVFKPGDRLNELILEKFRIEAPPGTIRISGTPNDAMAQDEFVNLLSIDRTGLYDYDDDPSLDDMVLVKDEQPMIEVIRCDFDVASLFIRP